MIIKKAYSILSELLQQRSEHMSPLLQSERGRLEQVQGYLSLLDEEVGASLRSQSDIIKKMEALEETVAGSQHLQEGDFKGADKRITALESELNLLRSDSMRMSGSLVKLEQDTRSFQHVEIWAKIKGLEDSFQAMSDDWESAGCQTKINQLSAELGGRLEKMEAELSPESNHGVWNRLKEHDKEFADENRWRNQGDNRLEDQIGQSVERCNVLELRLERLTGNLERDAKIGIAKCEELISDHEGRIAGLSEGLQVEIRRLDVLESRLSSLGG
jgi:hypothetical protein